MIPAANVGKPHFERMYNGEKTCEGRLEEKVIEWGIKVGSEMIFRERDGDRKLRVKIIAIEKFADFGHAFNKYGSRLVDCKSAEDAIKLYNEFYEKALSKGSVATVIEFVVIARM